MKFLFVLLVAPIAIATINYISLAPSGAVQVYHQAQSNIVIVQQLVDPDVIFRGLINH